jgi:hypothetical protein
MNGKRCCAVDRVYKLMYWAKRPPFSLSSLFMDLLDNPLDCEQVYWAKSVNWRHLWAIL